MSSQGDNLWDGSESGPGAQLFGDMDISDVFGGSSFGVSFDGIASEAAAQQNNNDDGDNSDDSDSDSGNSSNNYEGDDSSSGGDRDDNAGTSTSSSYRADDRRNAGSKTGALALKDVANTTAGDDGHVAKRKRSHATTVTSTTDGSIVAFEVQAVNERDAYKSKLHSAQDDLQAEKISHAVTQGRVQTEQAKVEALRKKVAGLERLRQTSKEQVKTLLNELSLRQQEHEQTAQALKTQLATTTSKLAAAEKQVLHATRDSEATEATSASQLQRLQATSTNLASHLQSRNTELDKRVQELEAAARTAQAGLDKQKAENERLQKELESLRDRQELRAGPLGSSAADDHSVDARVRQLAQEARFNSHLRLQMKRIRDLTNENKVLVQTQLEKEQLEESIKQLDARRQDAEDTAAKFEAELQRQKRLQEVWTAQWRRLFGEDCTKPADVAKRITALRAEHVQFQVQTTRVAAYCVFVVLVVESSFGV